MKLLVTGGAGFIGSALTTRLVSEGYDIVAIDNFNEYYDVSLKHARVAALLPGVLIHTMDITDKVALRELFLAHSFDAVCHLAGQAGVRYSVESPESYISANILGTQTLFEVMREVGCKRMVFASTSSVYGTSTQAPFSEDARADCPVSIYAATKRAAEMIAYTYYHQYQIETTCLRFFTVYGPWSRPDMAMITFADALMEGEPMNVFNQGDLKRDFTYIDDIVSGFVAAIERPLGYQIINLGNGAPVALLDFISCLESILGRTIHKHFLPMQIGDVYETYADITKAKAVLNYSPKTDLATGVAEFVRWYLSYRE